jgi:pimeloyl-ACP methyl ester carboxylesterase
MTHSPISELVSSHFYSNRWGLGRTEPRSKSAKGIIQWAAVVEEVLDLLRIDQCSVMAHSAGAPCALSFANKLPRRIRGDICLLAPWVGGGEGGTFIVTRCVRSLQFILFYLAGGYKWLKYVPNGILKTAQAAEWKLQAWMIGKPPTIAFEGIGYNAQTASSHTKLILNRKLSPPRLNGNLNVVYPSSENKSRPSMGSLNISEYDDLRDFDGRFENRSTLVGMENNTGTITKRQLPRGFLERLKGSKSQPQTPTEENPVGKKLKALRSMSSLKGKSSSAQKAKKSETPSPKLPLPQPLAIELGLGFDQLSWPKLDDLGSFTPTAEKFSPNGPDTYRRVGGLRSVSFTTSQAPSSLPGSPARSSFNSSFVGSTGGSYETALGNALIAASHAESPMARTTISCRS